MILYATSRKGLDLNIHPSSSTTTLRYPTLDIANPASVINFANQIQRDHSQIDVLINNAGVNLDARYSPLNATTTLKTNYRGTLRMCQAFIPLLRQGTGRIVNVSSVASALNGYSSAIQMRFRDPDLTLDELDAMTEEYLVRIP